MLTGLISRLRGQVWVRVECPFPERVLNLCGERNLAFWDLEWESETAFTCRLSRQDFAALRRAVEPLDCSLRVVRREGAPYFPAARTICRVFWTRAGRYISPGETMSLQRP